MSSLQAEVNIFVDTNIVLVYTYHIDEIQFSLNIYPTIKER